MEYASLQNNAINGVLVRKVLTVFGIVSHYIPIPPFIWIELDYLSTQQVHKLQAL